MGVFLLLFKVGYLRISKLQATCLCQNNTNYLVYHIYKNRAVIKTFYPSKHKKSRVYFSNFKTWVYLNIK